MLLETIGKVGGMPPFNQINDLEIYLSKNATSFCDENKEFYLINNCYYLLLL
jgi:negative regulator of genetic competence, sporulation and motility